MDSYVDIPSKNNSQNNFQQPFESTETPDNSSKSPDVSCLIAILCGIVLMCLLVFAIKRGSEISDLKEQVTQLTEENSSLKSDNEALTKQTEKLQTEYKQVQEELDETKEELRESKDKAEAYDDVAAAIEDLLNALNISSVAGGSSSSEVYN